MRADIAPGGIFPDYELTDHTKARRRLSELQGSDPMILMLARPLLPEGPPAAPRARILLFQDHGGGGPSNGSKDSAISTRRTSGARMSVHDRAVPDPGDPRPRAGARGRGGLVQL